MILPDHEHASLVVRLGLHARRNRFACGRRGIGVPHQTRGEPGQGERIVVRECSRMTYEECRVRTTYHIVMRGWRANVAALRARLNSLARLRPRRP